MVRPSIRSHEPENTGKPGDVWDDIFIPAASIFMVSILVAALRIPISENEREEFVSSAYSQDERLIMAGGRSNYIDTRTAEAVDRNDTEKDLATVLQW
jgi:hypothetical protein